MKHFSSHALMLLVQVPDESASRRIMMETDIDPKTKDRRIRWPEISDRGLPSSQ